MNLRTPFARVLAWTLMTTLALNPLGPAMAQISVASGATTMGQAGNGVPVVNIAAPNERGLSHNRFNDYNVGTQGLILNNANGAYQSTQLGGYIVGNPNLQGKEAARLILNEVTGGRPSSLAGYTEIAGQAARLVVANPWGISCNGCGFLNTPRVTLSTGTPRIEDGRLAGFRVDGGEIAIDGAGLNASNIDQFDLITRSAKINAELYAQRLNIIAGRNDVAADDLSATALAADGAAPLLAIDSAALGGMYANSIMLLGTEAGVGVRLAGDLAASAGDIRIDSAGKLTINAASAAGQITAHAADVEVQKQLYAGTQIDLAARESLVNAGTLAARDAITLSSDGVIANRGYVEAGVNPDSSRNANGDIWLNSRAVNNSGSILANRDLVANLGEVSQLGGQLFAARSLSLIGQTLENRSGVVAAGGQLRLAVDRVDNQGGKIIGQGDVAIEGGRFENSGGTLVSEGDLSIRLAAGDISALDLNGSVTNTGGAISSGAALEVFAARVGNQQGRIEGGGAVSLSTGALDNTEGDLISFGRLDLTGGEVINSSGRIASAGALVMSATGLLQLHGELFSRSTASLDLNQGELNNDGGLISAVQSLEVRNASVVSNRGGELSSGQSFMLLAASLNNEQGRVLSDAGLTLDIDAAVSNLLGLISGNHIDLAAGRVDNRAGTLYAQGDLRLEVANGLDNGAEGLIQSGAALVLESASIDNRGGSLLAGQSVALTVTGKLDNRDGGLINSQGELALEAAGLDSGAGGEVSAKRDMQLWLGTLAQRGGVLIGEGDLGIVLGEGGLDNEGGVISSNGALVMTSSGTLSNHDGEISSLGALVLNATSLDNRSGQIIGRDQLQLGLGSVDNRGGLLSGWLGLALLADTLDNRELGTLSSRGGNLNLQLEGELLNSGEGALVAAGRLDIQADRLDNHDQGILSSGAGQGLKISGILDNRDGQIDSGAELDLDVVRLDNRGGLILAAGSLEVTGHELDNASGQISASGSSDFDLDGAFGNAGGQVASGGPLVFAVGAVDNRGGTLASQDALYLDAASLDNSAGGTLAANGTLGLAVTGTVDNSGDGLIYSRDAALALTAGELDNQNGTLQSQGKLSVALDGELLNGGGTLLSSGGKLEVEATNLDNRGGTLASVEDAVRLLLSGWLSNGAVGRGGLIQGKRLDLNVAGTISNDSGSIHALAGDAKVSGTLLDNQRGVFYVQGNLSFTGGGLDNRNGQIGADDVELQLAGALDNRQGTVESGSALLIAAESVDNQGGQLRALGSSGKASLQLSGLLDNRNGLLEAANEDLVIAVGGLTNDGGSVRHGGSGVFGLDMIQLGTAGGSFITQGSLSLTADTWSNSSTLQAAHLTLDIGTLTQTAGGQLLAVESFTGNGAEWSNDGVIASDGAVSLNLTGTYGGAGRLSSLEALSLTAAKLDLATAASIAAGSQAMFALSGQAINRGRITAVGDLAMSAAAVSNYGTLGSAENLTLSTPSLLNEHGLIFSGESMGLYVASFTNRYADVYSLGELRVARDAAGSRADRVENVSGTLESAGDMQVSASQLVNRKDRFSVERKRVSGNINVYWDDFCDGKGCELYFTSVERYEDVVTDDTAASFITSGGSFHFTGSEFSNLYSVVSASGDIAINTSTFSNIGAGGGEERYLNSGYYTRDRVAYNAFISNKNLFNQYNDLNSGGYAPEQLSVADVMGSVGYPQGFYNTTEYSAPTSGAVVAQAVVQAGGDVVIQASERFDNSVVQAYATGAGNIGATDTQVALQSSTFVTPAITTQLPPDLAQQQVNPLTLPGFSLPTGQNGLFRLNGESGTDTGVREAANDQSWNVSGTTLGPGQHESGVSPVGSPLVQGLPVTPAAGSHKYLVESNAALTELANFLSSDYLLGLLGEDGDTAQRRLGDGLYEQRLIREAVLARTGQRYLADLNSDEAMFRYLMDNAVASKEALSLSVGVSLTAEQVAALTHDIVWLESYEVNGEEVLVPVLYLAQGEGRLAPTGALVQGRNLTLISGGDLSNQGTLRASANLDARAAQLANSGLIEAGERLALLSDGDLINRAGGIIAGRDVSLVAGRDIINERTVTTLTATGGGDRIRDDVLSAASRIEAFGDLQLSAGRDILNIGSSIRVDGDANLSAGRDVIIDRAEEIDLYEYQRKRETGYQSSITQYGSSIEVGGDLYISATRDVGVVASQVVAGGDVGIIAGESLVVASAADESHQYSRRKQGNTRTIRQNDSVAQVPSLIEAGGSVALLAGENMVVAASEVRAGEDAYLYAGGQMAILAAENSEYSLYDMKKKGSLGAKKTQRDEVTTVTQVGSRIEAGNDLTIESGGDQRYQLASLKSGRDLTLDSGGDIDFEGVKDLKQESHEKSSSSWAWTSAKGKGRTDETLRQSELVAAGNLVIEAAGKIRIDIPEVNAQTVTQTIDALVEAEPKLAWLKEMESRGDIDWQRVKEVHDQWKYSHSGMGAGLAIIVAIVVTVLTWGAASGAIAGAANAGAGTAAAAAGSTMAVGGAVNTALTAAVTSMASNAAINTINSGGDLGKALSATFSEEAMKGYLTSAVAAGITAGLVDSYFADKGGAGTGGIDVDLSKAGQASAGTTGPSFNLDTWSGIGKFAAYQGSRAVVSAGVDTAINGGSFEDKLATALTQQAIHVVSAVAFNEVGNWAEASGIKDGSIQKIAVKALVGGLISQAATGDFATGALAAGANEALVVELRQLVGKDEAMLTTASQLVGALSSALSGGDPNLASNIAMYDAQYNYLNHTESKELEAALQRRDACGSDLQCRQETQSTVDRLRALDKTRDLDLAEACKNPSSPQCEFEYANLIVAADSYKGKSDSGGYSIVGQEGSSAQALVTQYRARMANPSAFNAGTAAIETSVAELTGTVQLVLLTAQAAAGDLDAQAQLSGMVEALGDFLQAPIDSVTQNIKSTLDEADRLEANGQIDEAERIRAGLVTSGILAITGNGKVFVKSSGNIVGEVPVEKIVGGAKGDAPSLLPKPGDTSVPASGVGAGATFKVESTKQLGKKLGKHVEDFGGNPGDPADRKMVFDRIQDIGNNPEKVIPGSFSGQGAGGVIGDVFFRIKGNDVVVTKPDGSFVTILKDGVIGNTFVKNALKGQ